MTGASRVRPRVAVDTNVLYDRGSLGRLLLAADQGLITPLWSAQIAAELARVKLWRGELRDGRRSITGAEYREYRLRVYGQIDQIDRRCEIVRVAPSEPTDDEVAWAEAADMDDLHVQLLARVAKAGYVVSLNHHDFPARQVVDGAPRGELSGIVWITPDRLLAALDTP